MTDWDKRFVTLAKDVAKWSKDTKKKVGAVIVDDDKRILSTGYNGIPQGCNDDDKTRYVKPKKNYYFEHAESNAIFSCAKSGVKTKNSNMYLTWFPCDKCARAIIQSGIKKIVCYEPDYQDDYWGVRFKASREMLNESGVNIQWYADEDDGFAEMIPENIKETSWNEQPDEGYKGYAHDWLQTLVTKINQVAAKILKANGIAGANMIRIHPELEPLFKRLMFYDEKERMLSGRYEVIKWEGLEKNEIIVYYNGLKGYHSDNKSEDNYFLIKIV